MNHMLQYSGYWWIPENPSRKLSGSLTIHPFGGCTLELLGSFDAVDILDPGLVIPIIVGMTQKIPFTLLRCYLAKSEGSHPGLPKLLFRAELLIEGGHFFHPEEIVFDSLSIEYSHLQQWAGLSGISHRNQYDENGHFHGFEVSFRQPDRVRASLPTFDISIGLGFATKFEVFGDYSIAQSAGILVEPRQPLPYNEYKQQVCRHIQNFLSLGIGQPISAVRVAGKANRSSKTLVGGRVYGSDVVLHESKTTLEHISKTFAS